MPTASPSESPGPSVPAEDATSANSDGNSGEASKDPVSSATGELYFSTVDLALGGPYPPLALARHYGSFLSRDPDIQSALGINWMHSFDLRLLAGASEAKVVYSRGKSIEFRKTGGSWVLKNPDPVPYRLREETTSLPLPGTGTTEYVLLDPSRDLILTFSGDGRLKSVRGRNERTLELTYAAGLLSEVSDGLGRSLRFSYTGGKLTEVRDQSGRRVTFGHDGDNLIQYTDARGNTTTYEYEEAGGVFDLPFRATTLPGLVVSSTRPAGNTPYTQEYDSEGRVTSQMDSGGNETRMSYDTPSAGTTRVTDPLGYAMEHIHQGYKNLTRVKDKAGEVYDLSYDSAGHRSGLTDRLGDSVTTTYHAESGKPATRTDALGRTTRFTYTAQSQLGFTFYNLSRVDYPDGTFITLTHDSRGNVLTLRDQSGAVWSYTYNAAGQVLTARNPAGGVTTYAYNPDATLKSTTDPSGNTTLFGYDALKRLNRITHPDATFRHLSYDANDNLLTVTDERGKIHRFAYDGNDNLERATDPSGKSASFAYDGNDRLLTVTDRLGKVTTYGYDELGRVKTVKNPAGETITFGYTPQGWLSTVTDPAGKTVTRGYDKEGVLKSLTDALSNTWNYASDKLGRITQVTSPLSHIQRYTYDSMGRLTTSVNPLSQTTGYSYDKRGLLTGITLPEGISSSYTRNPLGLVSRVSDPKGKFWDRGYDVMGRLTLASDPLLSVIRYSYDTRSRVSRIDYPPGSQQVTYDPTGNVTRRRFSDGTDLGFTYDNNGRLLTTDGLSLGYDARGDLVSCNGLAITRDIVGRILTLTLAPGKTVSYGYDPAGRLSRVNDWVGGETTLGYDDNGRLITLTRPNGLATAYSYDKDGRLIRIEERNGGVIASIDLTRNGKGEVTAALRDVPIEPVLASHNRTATYNAAGEPLGHSYDTLGRLSSDGVRNYRWNLASRLTGYTEGSGTVSFSYDGLGMRVSRTQGGVTRQYVWNHALGLPSVSVVREGGRDLRYYLHLPDGRLLHSVEARDSTRSFYHFDEMGSTVFLSNDAGSLTDAYGLTPYGELKARAGSFDNPFTFIGAFGVMQEGDSGLYYMRARYYDAALGRFLSRDPVKSIHPMKTNPYRYGKSNPCGNIDPEGLSEFSSKYPWINDYLPGNEIERIIRERTAEQAREANRKFVEAYERAKQMGLGEAHARSQGWVAWFGDEWKNISTRYKVELHRWIHESLGYHERNPHSWVKGFYEGWQHGGNRLTFGYLGEEDTHLKGSGTDTFIKYARWVPTIALGGYAAGYAAQGAIAMAFIMPEVATSASAWAMSTPAGLWVLSNPDKVVGAVEVVLDVIGPDPPGTLAGGIISVLEFISEKMD